MGQTGIDVLARIADDRRRRVQDMMARVPGHALKAGLGPRSPAGRLERALRRDGPAAAIRLVGADAVLRIAALLSEVQRQRLIGEARLLGLDSLVEVHDGVELERSLRAGATVIGINNRDLRTLEVDLGTALELLPRVPPLVTAV